MHWLEPVRRRAEVSQGILRHQPAFGCRTRAADTIMRRAGNQKAPVMNRGFEIMQMID